MNKLALSMNKQVAQQGRWLGDDARSMGIHLVAGKGSGKSRFMGRILMWQDFLRNVPMLILDPVGSTIDNFYDKFLYLPQPVQEQLWKRVVHVDMSGKQGYVVPFPLYYRLDEHEDLAQIASRFLQAVRRLDPYLEQASIQGWNALHEVGIYTGMVLTALGGQITEASTLLDDPEPWLEKIRDKCGQYVELEQAYRYFVRYKELSPSLQERATGSFRNKITMFNLDSGMRAMFGASIPGIDWQEVIDKKLVVLLDFRHEHDVERRRFKMYWVFSYFLEFIKWRGHGRHHPIGLVIDELTALTNMEVDGQSIFASDLDELINVYARNCRLWLTIAHQEQFQLDERLQKTLGTMGTQMIGSTSDMEAALKMAESYFKIDPLWAKRYERVWMSNPFEVFVVDVVPVEYTVEEQQYLSAYTIKDQPSFHFLVRLASGEGNVHGPLRAISFKGVDAGLWVQEALVTRARQALIRHCGQPIKTLLTQTIQRQERLATIGQKESVADQTPPDSTHFNRLSK